MANEKSWQARIGEATDKLAQSFVESISYDRRLYKHDIAGSIAHAKMLAHVGLLTEDEKNEIVQGLYAIEKEMDAGTFVFDESLEDIHMVIEDALTKRTRAGRKLHTARSRNDQVSLDLILWVRDAARAVFDQTRDLCKSLVDLALRSGDTVLPSYTHLQRAQPIFAGAEALAWAVMFDRSGARALHNVSPMFHNSPLGSGAIAGSSLPIDVEATAKSLRFLQGPANSIDHTASRDLAVEFVFALAMLSMTLSRWAEQWIIYSTTEFSFIKIADRYTTGSSMMPQKRNPDMLELIRGRCGTVYGNLFALLTILKGLPIGYNRDLQEDKRHVFQAYDTVSACLTMAAAIVSSSSFVRENIEPTLERGFLDATSLAEYFVTKGVPFRTAHQIVGSLVARCEREGKSALAQLSVNEFVEAVKAAGAKADQVGQDVYEALGTKNVVRRYRSAGAAGGEPYERQLAEWKKRLGMET